MTKHLFGFGFFEDNYAQFFYYTGKIGRECFSVDKSLAKTNLTLDEINEEISVVKELGYMANDAKWFLYVEPL